MKNIAAFIFKEDGPEVDYRHLKFCKPLHYGGFVGTFLKASLEQYVCTVGTILYK